MAWPLWSGLSSVTGEGFGRRENRGKELLSSQVEVPVQRVDAAHLDEARDAVGEGLVKCRIIGSHDFLQVSVYYPILTHIRRIRSDPSQRAMCFVRTQRELQGADGATNPR